MVKRNMQADANKPGELSYNTMSSGCDRRTAAGVFAKMLQLNDQGFVALEQNVAYGDIMIAPGPRFEEHLEVEDCFESVIPIPMAFPSDESIVALSSPIVVSSSLVASNESIIALPLVAARNKGGRINGSTNANKRRGILDKKRAVNWVCHQYHERQAELKDANKSN